MNRLFRRTCGLVGFAGALTPFAAPALPALADTKTEIKLTTEDVDSKESAMGDLIADAIKTSAKTDAAFIAASSFKEVSLAKGSVSAADVLRALEYKDENILIVKLTGDQISRALQHGLYLYPKPNSAFLQFSGLTVTINPDADRDKRVQSIKINGDPLDANKTYKVAMPETLANGALAYFKIWKKTDIDKNTNKMLETAVTTYLSDRKTLAKGDDRLVLKTK